MTQSYDLNTVREGIKAIVEERGADFVYGSGNGNVNVICRYVPLEDIPEFSDYLNGTNPYDTCTENDTRRTSGCLIGEYMKKIGVDYEFLTNTELGVRDIVISLRDQGEFKFTEEASDWMQIVQACQDRGDTWGDSVNRADTLMGNL